MPESGKALMPMPERGRREHELCKGWCTHRPALSPHITGSLKAGRSVSGEAPLRVLLEAWKVPASHKFPQRSAMARPETSFPRLIGLVSSGRLPGVPARTGPPHTQVRARTTDPKLQKRRNSLGSAPD